MTTPSRLGSFSSANVTCVVKIWSSSLTTVQPMSTGDQQGRQFEDLEVTVDTGSTFTAVPRTLLQRLGVPVRRSARSRLADGSSAPMEPRPSPL